MPSSRKSTADLTQSMALIVVDVQDCFIDAFADKDDFLGDAPFAIDAAQTLGIRTIFTEQVPDKLGPTSSAETASSQFKSILKKELLSLRCARD